MAPQGHYRHKPQRSVLGKSWFHSLKVELVRNENFNTRQEAFRKIAEYIDVFYNRQRRHSTLGGMSPESFETMLDLKTA